MSPARKSTRKKKPPAKPPRSQTRLEVVSGDRSQRLGGRHECYACQTKFYDLNKPEPVCPKCQANQLQQPKDEPAAKAAPAVNVTDVARKLAEEHGLDLGAIEGTGAGGRILKGDVERAIREHGDQGGA